MMRMKSGEVNRMVNLSAELERNLEVYNRYYQSRAAVDSPGKVDVPMVGDSYMDTEKPVGTDSARETELAEPSGFGDDDEVAEVTYRSPIPGDLDFLGLINDRLKTQSRRYPHPITNEMEEVG